MGDDEDRREIGGRVEAVGVEVGDDDDAAEQRGGDVVRVTLDAAGDGKHVRLLAGDLLCGEDARDDRRRARSEAAGQGDVGGDLEAQAVGRMDAFER